MSVPLRILADRYELHGEIAAGGMATVHYGRLVGPVGFSRTVAIKRLHPQYAKDPDFVAMFMDEARLAGRIRHPNVVGTLDVVAEDGELFLVMDYVQGESLARLMRSLPREGGATPPPIALSILIGVLNGLHAAHEAKSQRGEPLGIVHRDVSPQNILVGVDGVARIIDFGVAKAEARAQTTREGQLKGKLSYMSPEQLRNERIDRRSDVYSASVVLWETLTGQRLITADDAGGLIGKLYEGDVAPPSATTTGLARPVDGIIRRGLARDPAQRFATARDMALALEALGPVASASEVGAWVEARASDALRKRQRAVSDIESLSVVTHVSTPGGRSEPPRASVVPAETSRLEASSMDESHGDTSPAIVSDRKPSQVRVRALTVVAGMALASLGTFLVMQWMPRVQAHGAAPDSSSSGTAAAPEAVPASPAAPDPMGADSVAPPEPIGGPDPKPSSEAVASPTATAERERGAKAAPAAIPTSREASRRPDASARSPSTARAADCSPGFYYDADGLKTWKPECLSNR